MKAQVQLMHEDGGTGPMEIIEVPEDQQGQVTAVRAWAVGQTDQPGSRVTVFTDDGHYEIKL